MTRKVIEYPVQVIKTDGEILCHEISGITYTLRKSRHYGNITRQKRTQKGKLDEIPLIILLIVIASKCY